MLGGSSPKIAVMGAGGIGGYYGGMLARAGFDVRFIARGEHLKATQQKGLKVISTRGEFSVQVKATSEPSQVGPVDLVLFCVKSYDTEDAARAIISLVEREGSVLTVQNGVDNHEKIGAIVGSEKVLAGAAFIFSQIEAPGIIRQSGGPTNIIFGEIDGEETERARQIEETMKSGGLVCELAADVRKVLWEKFVWVCAIAGVTCLTRLPIGRIVSTQETRAMLHDIMEEATKVARAADVPVGDKYVDRMMDFADHLEKSASSSMLRDLAGGRRLELQALHGTVVRLGQRYKVPTPMNGAVYATLKPHESGR